MLTVTQLPRCGSGFRDLAGQRFGRLTVLGLTGRRAGDGCYYWLCRCQCGSYTEVSSNRLLQGRTTSCGCYGKERRDSSRTYVGGTCLEIVKSPKIPKNNTSGVKGVSLSRGLWLAKISLSGKQFFLGRYRNMADAVAIYQKAEALRNEVLEDVDTLAGHTVEAFARRLAKLRKK